MTLTIRSIYGSVHYDGVGPQIFRLGTVMHAEEIRKARKEPSSKFQIEKKILEGIAPQSKTIHVCLS